MSHMNESYHRCMSHVTYEWVMCVTYSSFRSLVQRITGVPLRNAWAHARRMIQQPAYVALDCYVEHAVICVCIYVFVCVCMCVFTCACVRACVQRHYTWHHQPLWLLHPILSHMTWLNHMGHDSIICDMTNMWRGAFICDRTRLLHPIHCHGEYE